MPTDQSRHGIDQSTEPDRDAEPDHVEGMATWLTLHGYSACTIESYTYLARQFLRWVARTGGTVDRLGASDLDSYGAYLQSSGRCHRRGRSGCNSYTSARQLVAHLQRSSFTIRDTTTSPGDRLLNAFEQWTRSHRGLMDSTISNYSGVVRDLIETVGQRAGEVHGPRTPLLRPEPCQAQRPLVRGESRHLGPRVPPDYGFEVVIEGKRYTAAEARRGIELPPGRHEGRLTCLDCPEGVVPNLTVSFDVVSGEVGKRPVRFE